MDNSAYHRNEQTERNSFKSRAQMEVEEFSDRMATDILSIFDPLNEPSSFTYGDAGDETDVLPKPSSDHQRVVEYQLNGHTSPEQDLLGEDGVLEANNGREDMMPHSVQRSSPDATRSSQDDGRGEQTWSGDTLEQWGTPQETEHPGELKTTQEEGRIAATLAPEPERPESHDPKEDEPPQLVKDLRFHPNPTVRTFAVDEASGTEENGEGGNGYLRNVTGSIMGHANLVKKHLEFFAQLPEKQRLSPRVRRLMEVGPCKCRIDWGLNGVHE